MAYGNRFTRWIYNQSPVFFREFMTTVYSYGRSQRKYGSRFQEYLTDLERTQWYNNEELQLLQNEKIRQLIWQASCHVPYYSKLFKQISIDPGEIWGKADLTRLPTLEKNIVQAEISEFRSLLYLDPKTVEHFQSSGTTGKALDVYVALDAIKMEKAFVWLQRSWAGIKPGDRVAYFTGFPIVPVNRKRPPYWIYDRMEDRLLFSLQHMSKDNLIFYAKKLKEFQPLFFVGYPTAIYLMALYLCDSGDRSIRLKGVFTSSETLLPHQRQIIEQAFGCLVYDLYGSTEYVGNIVQCEYQNYHIKNEFGVVEILKPDGTPALPGQVGEIVCTGLINMAMPFIRYRTGDTAVPKSGVCNCGRGGQLVEQIRGRIEDIIISPDGRYLSRLDFVFKGLLNVKEAQLIQETPEYLRVRIVPNQNYSDADNRKIVSNLRERLGDRIFIECELIDRIPRTANGKFRYVISKVPLDWAGARQTGEILGIGSEEEK